jgi:hypothetical protein
LKADPAAHRKYQNASPGFLWLTNCLRFSWHIYVDTYRTTEIKINFPARKVKVGFGNWILGFEIYL